MFPHSANFPYRGPHSTPAYENQPPPLLHPKHQHPEDAPLQMHHHNIIQDPTLMTMPAPPQSVLNRTPGPNSYHQPPNPVYPQPAAGATMPPAIGQHHATPYRHREEQRDFSDADPHTFSPTDRAHPHLRSYHSEDSSYTHESLHQMQEDAIKRGETQGMPRAKRGLSPSESLPLNFKREDSDEEGIVTKEIRELAGEIMEETSSNRIIKTDLQKPFDPNLVCPTCKKQFRIGEIQKYKRHANGCGKK